jgi:hypothetical protein
VCLYSNLNVTGVMTLKYVNCLLLHLNDYWVQICLKETKKLDTKVSVGSKIVVSFM